MDGLQAPSLRTTNPHAVNEHLSKPIIQPRILSWFVHPSTVPPVPLGYIRDNRGGALVIGGKTDSHYTGHGESWWAKFTETVKLG